MTISDLIQKLQSLPQDAIVCADSNGKGRWHEIFSVSLDFAVNADGALVKVVELTQDDEAAYAANVNMFE